MFLDVICVAFRSRTSCKGSIEASFGIQTEEEVNERHQKRKYSSTLEWGIHESSGSALNPISPMHLSAKFPHLVYH